MSPDRPLQLHGHPRRLRPRGATVYFRTILAQDVADRIKELLPRLEAELDHLRNTVKELFR